MRGRLFLGLAVPCALACNGLLSIDNYRACQGAECDGGVVADAPAEASAACAASADCPSATPVCSGGACASVVGLSHGMSNFACAVLSDGTARCWGQNDRGQLGSGQTSAFESKPVVVGGSTPLRGILSIVTGLGYGCALTNQNQVFCWGNDLASPGMAPTQIPVGTVSQITAAAGVNAGEGTACAVHEGVASCWGYNGAGRMGCEGVDASTCSSGVTPKQVAANSPIELTGSSSSVAATTYSTCSLVPGGGSYECWGDDSYGGLGDGTAATTCCGYGTRTWNAPADRLVGTEFYTCMHDNLGYWSCWGLSPGGAILGVPRGSVSTTPTLVSGKEELSDLAAGWYHSCAILAVDQSVVCWGQDDHGQIGDGSVIATSSGYVTTKTPAHNLAGVKYLAAHRNFTCAVNGDGQVDCWGESNGGSWLLGTRSSTGAPSTWDVHEPSPVGWD